MRKITAVVLAALLMFALVSCQQTPAVSVTPETPDIKASNATESPSVPDIGIALPTKSLLHWELEGDDIKKQLEAKGYTVELMYADCNQTTQNSQIEDLIAMGCKVLIISSIDGGALDSVLVKAKAAGITVIAYDRFLTNTMDVDYYVTFSYFRFGALQGEYIEDALGLKDGKGPYNIELFAGDQSDGNIMIYFKGGMSILQPYIENGQLVVKSGQDDWMDDIYTANWKSENAKIRMDDLLAKYYKEDKLDAVFALNDSIALGVITSLEDAGYTEFPIITGNDCEKASVIAIKAGKQSMSLFEDRRILSAKVVEMVDAVMTGREIQHTGNEHYSNGVTFSMLYNAEKQVPSFQLDPVVVTADNIQEILIDSGYYTEADLKG